MSLLKPALRVLFPALLGLAPLHAASPAAEPGGAALSAWPAGRDPREIGERVARRFVASPHAGFGNGKAPRFIIYPETCAWYGALTFAKAAGDRGLTAALVRRFDPLFGPEARLIPRPVNVDSTVFGVVPLELFIQTGDRRYLKVGLDLADRQWDRPVDLGRLSPEARAIAAQALRDGLTSQTRYWVDDMYMITMVQLQAYRATGDTRYVDRAAREMVAYLDRLQQPNGLFFHAPSAPFFWGRGNGWFAAGMSEMLRSLPAGHPLRPRILRGYRGMMAALLRHQDGRGLWHQLIDRPDAWAESSCTGMFTFAFVTGVRNGWLDPAAYGPAARRGWLGLVSLIDPNGDVRDVCEGTNKSADLRYYLDRGRRVGDMHGQAPILWCATALLRPAAGQDAPLGPPQALRRP